MEKDWVKVEERKPLSGQTVLAFYYDADSELEQFELVTYHEVGSVLGIKLCRCESKLETLLKNILDAEEVIAEEEGFYFTEYGEDGGIEFKKHADIFSHWKPLVAPKYKED